MKFRKFIDLAPLYAAAGKGGNGCCSFRREKFIPKGGPDGGDGGHGGDVILQVNPDISSLIHVFYQPHQKAKSGEPGKGKKMHGKNGPDLVVQVPCGTLVKDNATDLVLADLVHPHEQLVVARGGKGGLGNCHWVSSTHQAPHEHTDGQEGEEVTLRLELRIVADAGLIGFPNAGKSSILTRISDAHPKVDAYPFTTLNPIIGTLIFDDYTRMTVADIPGLIKDAHKGVGLGHAFLRHVERSSLMVFVIDMAGVDAREPHEDYTNLREELRLHEESLARRPYLVVANKMDLPEAAERLQEFKQLTGTDPLPVSAETGLGMQELKQAIRSAWQGI